MVVALCWLHSDAENGAEFKLKVRLKAQWLYYIFCDSMVSAFEVPPMAVAEKMF